MERETFKEQKAAYDKDIETLKQKISDVAMAEALVENEVDKAAVARSVLDITAMTDGVWDQSINDVIVYSGSRLEIHWNFD